MMMDTIKNKIKNFIRLARVTREDKDDGIDSIVQCEGIDKPLNAMVAMPYGVSANVPKNATLVLLSNNGTSQSVVGIPTFPENRFRDLKEWEVKSGNYKTKCFIYFQDDGSVKIKAGADGGDIVLENKDATVKATMSDSGLDIVADTDITGDVNVTGDTTKLGDERITGDLNLIGDANLVGNVQHNFSAAVINSVATGTNNVVAPTITVTAAGALTLNGGGSVLLQSSGTVDINAPTVNINGVPQ